MGSGSVRHIGGGIEAGKIEKKSILLQVDVDFGLCRHTGGEISIARQRIELKSEIERLERKSLKISRGCERKRWQTWAQIRK